MFAGGGWNPAVVFISRDEKEMTLVVGDVDVVEEVCCCQKVEIVIGFDQNTQHWAFIGPDGVNIKKRRTKVVHHTHIYIYIYIYICGCRCETRHKESSREKEKKREFILQEAFSFFVLCV
jgi:hypothetical protein